MKLLLVVAFAGCVAAICARKTHDSSKILRVPLKSPPRVPLALSTRDLEESNHNNSKIIEEPINHPTKNKNVENKTNNDKVAKKVSKALTKIEEAQHRLKAAVKTLKHLKSTE